MNDIANLEKVALGYDDERYKRTAAPTLVAHTYAHAAPPPQPKTPIANPAPLGFFANAITAFIFSLYNFHARGVTIPNAGVGTALFLGGFCQFTVGMWAFALGNTFAATAFSAYGSFWLAYSSTFLLPGFGISSAYADHPGQVTNATGILMAAWTIVTLVFLIATLRINVVVVLFFFFLEMEFLIYTISDFTRSLALQKVGAGFGLAFSSVALYAAAANLLTEDISWITLPVGDLSPERD